MTSSKFQLVVSNKRHGTQTARRFITRINWKDILPNQLVYLSWPTWFNRIILLVLVILSSGICFLSKDKLAASFW